jgi:GTPase SAR1 family protein
MDDGIDTVVVIGDKGSGKTTLINSYLEKEDPLSTSAAIDYNFGRKPKRFSTNQSKDVIHFFELCK